MSVSRYYGKIMLNFATYQFEGALTWFKTSNVTVQMQTHGQPAVLYMNEACHSESYKYPFYNFWFDSTDTFTPRPSILVDYLPNVRLSLLVVIKFNSVQSHIF